MSIYVFQLIGLAVTSDKPFKLQCVEKIAICLTSLTRILCSIFKNCFYFSGFNFAIGLNKFELIQFTGPAMLVKGYELSFETLISLSLF